ncbi:TonB-dependent receptor [Sphingobium sp.]|uniref:TonB-dependent receptor n=1 Tax=Sphingobium sp. TaxID=1912891 RepID=UPI002C1D876F|nr:TonB-dependent receptor [Sphingobium sp.]HUD92998.1 TonB-dependent receptor [Sphingobium sp.]
MHHRVSAFLSSSCVLAGLLYGPAAFAQVQAEPAASDSAGLGEIVVTAQKRPSLAQKTPIAMSVLDEEAIQRNGISTVENLAGLAPGLAFSQSGAQTILTIRGVSSRDSTEIGDPAVALSIDGVYFQRALGLNATIFDLERIEVLRGPQGTLLGRNATGGALNIITAKPTDELGGYVMGEVGNYQTYNTAGAINLPVNDRLKLRAAFQTRDRDGFRNNAPARDGDDEHSKSARLSALLTPTERLSVLLTAEYTRLSGIGPVRYSVAPALNASGGADITQKPAINDDGETFPLTPGGYFHGNLYFMRWNVSYDLGFADLTYLGGYRDLKVERLAQQGGVYDTVRRNQAFDQREHPGTVNHELHLSSPQDGPLKWQIGTFYFREENDVSTKTVNYPGAVALTGPRDLLSEYTYPEVLSVSRAVFGQAGYKLTDTLEVEGGLRYSSDKKSRVGYNVVTNVPTYYATGATSYTRTAQDSRYSKGITTWHVGLNWQAAPRTLVYAKVDTGFKDGGFTDLAAYGPERITAYEIGTKSRFLGNSLQLNLSAYWYDYTDQQVSQIVLDGSGNSSVLVVNAGKARYKGIEADLNWLATPDDRLDAYVAYSDAQYTDFVAALNGTNVNMAGNRPPQAPVWSANFGYSHDFDLGAGTLRLRAQTHLESRSYLAFTNRPSERQGAYSRSDIILSYEPQGQGWSLEAYVRNLENENVLTLASATATAIGYQFSAPRTFGARARINF